MTVMQPLLTQATGTGTLQLNGHDVLIDAAGTESWDGSFASCVTVTGISGGLPAPAGLQPTLWAARLAADLISIPPCR